MSSAKIRLQDIAKAADVSIATVSMALADDRRINAATRKRIQAISLAAGYRRGRRARTNKPRTEFKVALALVGKEVTSHHFMTPLLDKAATAEIQLQVQAIDDSSNTTAVLDVNALAGHNDAVLLYGRFDHELLEELAALELPLVAVGEPGGDWMRPAASTHIVSGDAYAMGRFATTALIQAGHRRIGFCFGCAPPGFWFDRWRHGYLAAHAAAGLPVDEELLLATGPGGRNGVRAANRALALSEPVTAFVVADAYDASQLLAALRDAGRPIAEECIVVGGTDAQAQQYGVDSCPLLLEDQELLAQLAIEQLRLMREGRLKTPAQLVLPFRSRNFDKIAKRRD